MQLRIVKEFLVCFEDRSLWVVRLLLEFRLKRLELVPGLRNRIFQSPLLLAGIGSVLNNQHLLAPKLEDLSATRRISFFNGWLAKSDITLSTAADQTPIAPGKNISDVTRNGRRSARFVSTTPTRPRFSVQSARYAEKHRKYRGVDLTVERGELFALLGGSGSGKTTLLRLLAGFEQPDAGRILIDGQDMTGVPPYRRPVNMMFQAYALFPHMTVAENIGYGLRVRGAARPRIAARVDELLKLVRLDGLHGRYPGQLSGGQRQRVALARALVIRPTVLLLDEPLSNLDLKLREEMRVEIAGLQRRLGITTVFVTHDQGEALSMADRVAVFNHGRIVQVGSPEDVYERPRTRFVADFVGGSNVAFGIESDLIEERTVGRLGAVADHVDAAHGAGALVGRAAVLAEVVRDVLRALVGAGEARRVAVVGVAAHVGVRRAVARRNPQPESGLRCRAPVDARLVGGLGSGGRERRPLAACRAGLSTLRAVIRTTRSCAQRGAAGATSSTWRRTAGAASPACCSGARPARSSRTARYR